MRPQYGLEVVLGAHAVASRAERCAGGARTGGHTALDLFTGQCPHPHDQARPLWREAGISNCILDAALTKDLHRTGIDAACLWMDGGAGVTFSEQRGHPQPREQDRRRQSDRTTADDEDGNFLHGSSGLGNGVGLSLAAPTKSDQGGPWPPRSAGSMGRNWATG